MVAVSLVCGEGGLVGGEDESVLKGRAEMLKRVKEDRGRDRVLAGYLPVWEEFAVTLIWYESWKGGVVERHRE